MLIHGHNRRNGLRTNTHKVWATMIQRTTNPKNHGYSSYGGRGIIVCERWLKYENFLADMGECPHRTDSHSWKVLSINRIDNNGNYEPSNCKWATTLEQAGNRQNTIHLTFNGKTQCLRAWAREYCIPPLTLWRRIKELRWDVERALITSPQAYHHRL